VGIVIGSFMLRGHRLRAAGFKDSVAVNPKIEIVACLENADDDARSYPLPRQLIDEQAPDLIYFGAAGIKGGVEAVLDSGKPIRILTVDETKFTHDNLKKGVIAATVTQQPYEQGVMTIKILHDYLSNGRPPREKYNYTENQVKLKSSKLSAKTRS